MPLLWIATPIVAAAAFAAWHFLDLFPLVEYRHWIDNPDLAGTLLWFFHVTVSHVQFSPSTRTTSHLAVSVFSTTCGQMIPCHNAWQIALLLGAAALAGMTLLRQTGGRHPVLISAALALFLFSAPMLDAVSWQATVLDKCAALMSALFLWYVTRHRLGVLPDQIVLTALTVLTLNTKEAAWATLPSAALLALAQRLVETAPSRSLTLAAIGQVLMRFALPIAYGAIHVGLVFTHLATTYPGDFARVTSGDITNNLTAYARYMAGSSAAAAAVIAAAAVAMWYAPPRSRMMLGWAAVSLAGALSIPLRTTAQAPFYLLVPLLYFSFLAFWIAVAIQDALPRRLAALPTFAMAVLLVTRLAELPRQIPYALELAQSSRNFQQALAQVRDAIIDDMPRNITFLAGQPRAYMFLEPIGGYGRALARYILPPGASADAIEAVRRATDTQGPGPTLEVRLRPDMSVEALRRIP